MVNLGPTGKFPKGKISPGDEGELRLGVAAHEGRVHIHLGGPVVWFALPKDEAIAFAALIMKHAEKLP